MLDLLPRPAILGPVLLVVGYVVYYVFLKPDRSLKLPLIGAKESDWFPVLQATWRNTKDFKSALIYAYEHHKDEAVYMPTFMSRMVMLPAAETNFISTQPDNQLDMHEQVMENLQTDYTVMESSIVHNPVHHRLITTTLTNQIGNLVPDVAEETEWGFEQHWGTDTQSFRDVCIYETVRHMLGSVTNRVFVGFPLCRDRRVLDNGVAYAQDVPIAGNVLQLFWAPLRPLVAPLLTLGCRIHTRAFVKALRPEIEGRLRDFDARAAMDPEKSAVLPPPRNDFLQWSIAQAKASGDPYMWRIEVLAARVLVLNLAAVHTSSFALTAALLDMVSTRPEYIEELREEIRTQLAEHGDDGKRWNKRALAKMEKLDSFLRESTRLNSFVTIGLSRIVSNPDGITTPVSRVHLPKGTRITVPAYSVFRDEAVYGSDAAEFKPFRWAEQRREREGVAYVERARKAFPTTSPEFLAFGHGKNACPGRFFAANELKLMLGHAIMNYDFERLETRPPNEWYGLTMVPSFKATIRVRRREKAV